MTDPFDVLRRAADRRVEATVEIDPRFRADLLDEARRRLAGASGSARRQVASPTDIDERTEMTVMPVGRRPAWTRSMLLAAACLALVTATVVALTTLDRADGDEPAVTAPINVTTTGTSVPTGPPLTDEQLVAAIKLETADLGLTRPDRFGGYEVVDTDDPDWFDLDRYSARPGCSAFDSVFEPLASSTHGARAFGRPPSEPVGQVVAVFPDEATASAVFDGWIDPAFASCLESYSYQFVFRFGAPSEPPFAVSADEFAYYTFEQPGGQINAGGVVRVDRTLTFVDASITWFEPARPLMSEDEFGKIVDRVVARAEAALAGTPMPGPTLTSEPSPPVSSTGDRSPPSG